MSFFKFKKNVSRFDEDDSRCFASSSHFITRLPPKDAFGRRPEYCPKTDLTNINRKTLKEFLFDNHIKNNSTQYIHDKLIEYFDNSNKRKRTQISINIEFDTTYLKDLENFEFIVTKKYYVENRVNIDAIIRTVQLKYPFIVPDRTMIYVDKRRAKSNENIFNMIISEYINAIKTNEFNNQINNLKYNEQKERETIKTLIPVLRIQWIPLVIDLFIKDAYQFRLTGNEMDEQMWKVVTKKFTGGKSPIRQEASKKIKKCESNDENVEHVKYLSEAEKAAIYLYTVNGLYKELNRICRKRDLREINLWKPYGINIIRALKKLPYYWGEVYRGISWKMDNFEDTYVPNNVVLWDAFTSTTKKRDVAKKFAKKSVLFEIVTWHGRWIQPLSRYENEEEVLLVASTFFRVTSVKKNIEGLNYIVRLEEIVRPWSKKAILWVDDKPKGNKKIMEQLERNGIMVIPRLTTQDAIYFLEFELPFVLNRDGTNFRIITNMTRKENGVLVEDAGAKFIHLLRQKYYHHLVCVFIGNIKKSVDKCKNLKLNMDSVLVTNNTKELKAFVRNVLICPCANVVDNGNDDEKKDNNTSNKPNINRNQYELKKIEVTKTYGGHGQWYNKCNICYKKPKELVYHCRRGQCNEHKLGYDVCESCAMKAIKGELKLTLQDIPPEHLKLDDE